MVNKQTVQRVGYILYLLLILVLITVSILLNIKPAGAAGDAELMVSGGSIIEGDLGIQALSFLITRTHNTDAVTVTANTQDVTALAVSDYETLAQTVVFTAGGSLTATVQVSVSGDTLVEPNETFELVLSAPISATLSVTNAVGTILNDDETFVSITAGSVIESAGSLPYTVTLTNKVSQSISMTVSSADGSALVSDSDYQPVIMEQILFPAGVLTATGQVLLTNDATVELDETFTLTLSESLNATLAVTNAVATILNDDAGTVSIDVGTASESAVTIPYTLTLSAAASLPITVTLDSSDGTATVSDPDYQSIVNQPISIPAGTMTRTGQITITNDAKVEADETFSLSMGNLITNGLAISLNTKVNDEALILNDDSATVTLTGPTATFEGNSGLTPFVFTAKLDHPVDGGFELAYQTDSGTADTTTDLIDNDQSLTFAGTADEEQEIIINVRGDLVVEPTETFSVTLGSISETGLVSQISVTAASKIGTIIDDDSAGIFISDGQVVETDSGANQLIFTVTLSTEIVGGFSVDYSTADNSAIALAGDYEPISGTLNFVGSAFESKIITVTVYGDEIVEADEFLFVHLSKISSNDVAAFNSQGIGTIKNNDSASLMLSSAITLSEGDSDQTTVPFTVTLSHPVQGGFRLSWSAEDGTATGADGDFSPIANQLLFDGDSDESHSFNLLINGDLTVELDEFLSVQLDTVAGLIGINPAAILLPDEGRSVMLLNDDEAEIFLVGDSKQEGTASASTTFVVTATLSAAVDTPVSLNFETISGTAKVGLDFITANGLAVFDGNEGEAQTFEIAVIADEFVELNESFEVQVSISEANGRDVTFSANQATVTVTILDDDLTQLYLPLQYREWRQVDGPDLIVSHVDVGTNSITVTIKNQGTEPVNRPFWIDSYINPKIEPTGVNQTIIETESEGFVWGIDSDSTSQAARLPMLPGDEIVLTVGGQFYKESNSNFASDRIPAGSTIYVQVDSFNPNSTFGQVEENHEIAGFIYNNIFKTVTLE